MQHATPLMMRLAANNGNDALREDCVRRRQRQPAGKRRVGMLSHLLHYTDINISASVALQLAAVVAF